MRRGAGHAVARWRRSLQTRVLITTLLLSVVVVLLLGLVLIDQVTRGLLDAKSRAALQLTNAGLRDAQQEFDAADQTDPASVAQLVDQLVKSLANRGGAAGLYDVVILGLPDVADPIGSSGRRTNGIRVDSVPQKLRDFVTAKSSEGYAYTRLRYDDGRDKPGLVVGAPINAATIGPYQLYYLFPLDQEASTVQLVRQTVAFAGLALVALLAGVAYLVTRQVVTPVRLAARTAETLAAGRLEERMLVRGEDDLARLASSFNKMADGLQRQIHQLEELSRVQRRFVSDVSHELRTPLTTVRMAADVLHEARQDFDPAVARSAELLQNQLDRFEALLVDLLEISRHDAGAAVLDTEAVDLRPVIEQVVEAAEPLAARRGSRLLTQLPATPVVAEVDPRRVGRVLRNLVGNAVEHGEGKDIVVRMEADDNAVAIGVRDHGVGLRPGEAALVFNRFWRADPARARATGGTGLGLSIALEDARLHGGWLQAWGEPGRGSHFRLTLPRRVGADFTVSPLPLRPADAPGRPAVATADPGGARG